MYLRVGAAAIVVFAFLLTESPAFAASAKCNAQLRKCNSHCNLVYESKRANRTCRDRCKDKLYVCEAQPG
jgi:hypothetical protein